MRLKFSFVIKKGLEWLKGSQRNSRVSLKFANAYIFELPVLIEFKVELILQRKQ